jgi:hypothetical protein
MSALDSFLGKEDDAAEDPVQELLGEKFTPEQSEKPAPEPEKPEPEKPEGDAPEAEDGEGKRGPSIGKALDFERKAKNDWKEKAARYEGELTEIRRQMEEMRKQPPAPQQPAPQPEPEYVPDPMQDPRGFFQWQQGQMAREALNTRLHLSEAYARDRHGAEKVDAAVNEFKQAVSQNPALYQQMVQHPMPYEFVLQQAEALRLQREIGTDPTAYRARIEAEIRERVMAEMQGTAAPASRAPNLPPSLAGARSAAPRSMPAEAAGDMSLGDILRRR